MYCANGIIYFEFKFSNFNKLTQNKNTKEEIYYKKFFNFLISSYFKKYLKDIDSFLNSTFSTYNK